MLILYYVKCEMSFIFLLENMCTILIPWYVNKGSIRLCFMILLKHQSHSLNKMRRMIIKKSHGLQIIKMRIISKDLEHSFSIPTSAVSY